MWPHVTTQVWLLLWIWNFFWLVRSKQVAGGCWKNSTFTCLVKTFIDWQKRHESLVSCLLYKVGSFCEFLFSQKGGNEWFLFAKKFEWTLNFQCEAFNFSQFSEKKILCHNFMISQCSRVFAEKFLTLLNYNFQKRETFKSQIDITSCATFCLRHKTKQTLYFAWCDVVFLM